MLVSRPHTWQLSWLFLHMWFVRKCMTLDVQIISVLPYSVKVTPALPWTGAPLQLAVDDANARYAGKLNVSVKYLYNTRHTTCQGAAADLPRMLAEEYYTQSHPACIAIIGANCGDLTSQANFAREWNIPLFTNGIVTSKIMSNIISPTAITLNGNFDGYALDTEVQISDFYVEVVASLRSKVGPVTNGQMALNVILFNGRKTETVVSGLKISQHTSRVYFIATPGATALKILRIADSLGMTNGQYAYINMQPLQQDTYGTAALFSSPNVTDLNAFRSLLYFSTAITDGQEISALNKAIASLALTKYNTSYDIGIQPLDLIPVRSTYENVELFTSIITESGPKACEGLVLASMVSNRTFNLSTGPLYIDENNNRNLDIFLYGFNLQTSRMKIVALYNGTTQIFSWFPNRSIDWPNPERKAPLDVPVCGFDGQFCSSNGMLLSVVIPLMLLLIGVSILAIRLVSRSQAVSDRGQWSIAQKDLKLRKPSSEYPTGQAAYLHEKPVWVESVFVRDKVDTVLMKKLPIIAHLAEIRHPNVSTLLGLCFYPEHVVIVSPFCKRGSLLDLFAEINMDWDFKQSLIMDLAEGLGYIHFCPAHLHGFLRPKICLIDERFTLKIGDLGVPGLRQLLTKSNDPLLIIPKDVCPSPKTGLLEKSITQSPEGDIYAFGVITGMILMEEEALLAQSDSSHVLAPVVILQLQSLTKRCIQDDPSLRPKMRRVVSDLKQITNYEPQSIVEKILQKFSTYTATLENAVRVRSSELLSERQRCDKILQELLPNWIVEKLRNNIDVEAEYYDSASVYFGDLVGFVEWVSMTSPYHVIDTLNTIYTQFDSDIAQFFVQKIETVGDSYMVASGIPVRNGDEHVREICQMALTLMRKFNSIKALSLVKDLHLRIGIHSGSCAAGIIGRKVPRYCLFGDTVNTASRMESHGEGTKIHVSGDTAKFLTAWKEFRCVERGLIRVKGKGQMLTYWLQEGPLLNQSKF